MSPYCHPIYKDNMSDPTTAVYMSDPTYQKTTKKLFKCRLVKQIFKNVMFKEKLFGCCQEISGITSDTSMCIYFDKQLSRLFFCLMFDV